jgi:hypothetical protein
VANHVATTRSFVDRSGISYVCRKHLDAFPHRAKPVDACAHAIVQYVDVVPRFNQLSNQAGADKTKTTCDEHAF